ncbi:MAG: SAM-dependent methyltransferase [Flavobacteriales bacterium]|nr:SAM-dependent methyltransferase [Flavobacteriales bacterium]
MNKQGKLYLFPVTLGETPINQVIPEYNFNVLNQIDIFLVENIKTARRFLKQSNIEKPIHEIVLFEIGKHGETEKYPTYIKYLSEGKNIGVLSEAGCPGIADPGAALVALAQEKGYNVVPLVGPSSILLSLMASGFNGQNFCFHGYLPIENKSRISKLKDMERLAFKEKQTQLFIETPFRNNQLMKDILQTLNSNSMLCIAVDITTTDESIQTKTVSEWKKTQIDLHKRPCMFLIG